MGAVPQPPATRRGVALGILNKAKAV